MPTTREVILQAVRDWYKTALTPTVDDDQIIPANLPVGDRPALPYLTVQVTTADIGVGTDAKVFEIDGGSGNPTFRALGQRAGSVSVQGFGEDTSGWIEVATLRLERESVKAILEAAGLTVLTIGGTTDLSALVDTSIEPRFLREYEIGYAVADQEAEELIPVATFETGLILRDGPDDPDPLVVTISIAV